MMEGLLDRIRKLKARWFFMADKDKANHVHSLIWHLEISIENMLAGIEARRDIDNLVKRIDRAEKLIEEDLNHQIIGDQ